jgi:hypothetical protein
MPVTSSHDLQRERLLGACRLTAVADAAGVLAAKWESTSSPRVACSNGQGYLGGLHRGRLPFIEVWQAPDQTWERQSASGCGTMTTEWMVRVHVNGPSWSQADSLARGIAQVALAAIRSDYYLSVGNESMSELIATPLGFALDVSLSMEHTFSRTAYETDAVITPGDPVVVIPSVGGYTALISWDDASPILVWTMPVGQSLDNIEVQVVEAWDGIGAAIEVGIALEPDRYFTQADSELAMADRTYEQDFDEAGPIAIVCTITPGAGATAGKVRLQITTTATGS